MKPRQTAFALCCTLIALVWSGWDRLTWAMTGAKKRGWFVVTVLFFSLIAVWLIWPDAIKQLFK